MESRTEQLRNIAKVVHDIRPDWHTNGILQVLENDSRPVDTLRRIAIGAAQDSTARGPGVIGTRNEAPPAAVPTPPPVGVVLGAPKQPDEVARRGAAKARESLKRSREDPEAW